MTYENREYSLPRNLPRQLLFPERRARSDRSELAGVFPWLRLLQHESPDETPRMLLNERLIGHHVVSLAAG